jgi:hypothetical protein
MEDDLEIRNIWQGRGVLGKSFAKGEQNVAEVLREFGLGLIRLGRDRLVCTGEGSCTGFFHYKAMSTFLDEGSDADTLITGFPVSVSLDTLLLGWKGSKHANATRDVFTGMQMDNWAVS